MSSLDSSAWFFPNLGYRDSFSAAGIGDGADYPGGGIQASQFVISNSILSLNATYDPAVYPGGPKQNGPCTLPVKIGTFFWNTLQMLYGTVEVRGTLGGTGTHTAFWLFDGRYRNEVYQVPTNPVAGSFANEIDIIEALPFLEGNLTTLRQNMFSSTGSSVNTTTIGNDASQNFHTYKMVWTPASITFFVDGVQTNQITTNLPNGPCMFITDIELTDAGSGPVVEANFPTQVQIDYVKAWDQSNNLIFYDEFDGTPAFQLNNMSNITFNQVNGNFISGTASSNICAFLSNTISKSFLLVYTNIQNPIIADTLGNTYQKIAGPFGGQGGSVWCCPSNKNGGGANTVTVTEQGGLSFTSTVVYVAEYTGQIQNGSRIDYIVAGQSTGPNITQGPVIRRGTNETMITLGLESDFSGAITSPSGTLRATSPQTGASGVILMDQAFTTKGSATASWRMGTSGNPANTISFSLISTSSVGATGGGLQNLFTTDKTRITASSDISTPNILGSRM